MFPLISVPSFVLHAHYRPKRGIQKVAFVSRKEDPYLVSCVFFSGRKERLVDSGLVPRSWQCRHLLLTECLALPAAASNSVSPKPDLVPLPQTHSDVGHFRNTNQLT